MKKMVAVIGILLIIFIGMLIYKKQSISNTNVTAQDVEKIEKYISKIYLWREITKVSLPTFDDINQAPDIWIWECVKNNLDQFELTKEEIEAKAKELFGENFSKEFPVEGNSSFVYDNERQKYIASNIELDNEEDMFLINKIEKNKNTYIVEIVEYIEDYSNLVETTKNEATQNKENESTENENQNQLNTGNKNQEQSNEANQEEQEQKNKACIKNLQEEIIQTIEDPDSESEAVDIVKANIDKFTKKTITLQENDQGNIEIKSVKS